MSKGKTLTATPRAARLEARLTEDVKALLERAAALEGRSLSDFVIRSAAAHAEDVIRSRAIRLSVEDTLFLMDLLANPPEPNAHLRAAARRADQLIGG